MALSKMHQKVNAAGAKKRAIDRAEANAKAAQQAVADQYTPERIESLLTDDAELRAILAKADENNIHPDNAFWDDARRSYTEIHTVVTETTDAVATELESFVNDKERSGKLTPEQNTRLASLVTQFHTDTDTYLSDLEQTYALHADKKGGTVDGADAMQMLEIQDSYQQKAMLFNRLVTPVVEEINDLTGVTARALEAQERASKLLPAQHRDAQLEAAGIELDTPATPLGLDAVTAGTTQDNQSGEPT